MWNYVEIVGLQKLLGLSASLVAIGANPLDFFLAASPSSHHPHRPPGSGQFMGSFPPNVFLFTGHFFPENVFRPATDPPLKREPSMPFVARGHAHGYIFLTLMNLQQHAHTSTTRAQDPGAPSCQRGRGAGKEVGRQRCVSSQGQPRGVSRERKPRGSSIKCSSCKRRRP